MMRSHQSVTSDVFRPVIILPTYNNAATLPDIVLRAEALNVPLIIVDDGSTDGTSNWLAKQYPREAAGRICIVRHTKNRGKAAALSSGFASANEHGFTHAATIDTDGQLDPEDIPILLERARSNPRALVLGARDDRSPDYPSRSRLGRRLSNFAIRLECGEQVDDSQCGLRVYPLEVFDNVRCTTGRYGFEAAIIPLAVWQGFGVVNVSVKCRYFPAESRVSHFRPWRDSLHGVILHARLLMMKIARRSTAGPAIASPSSSQAS